jgi:hypothetical protein
MSDKKPELTPSVKAKQENDEKCETNIRHFFLKLLDEDEEVRGKIAAIGEGDRSSQKLAQEKDAKILVLQEKISALTSDISTQNSKYLALQKERDELKAQLNVAATKQTEALAKVDAALKDKKSIETEMAAMRQKYVPISELEAVYAVYESLPENSKISLSGFVRGDSLLSFVVSGSRDTRIEGFWEFCKTAVQKSDGLQYAPQLAKIFSFFFTKINSVTETALYELFEPPNGSRFDDNSMIVSNNSPAKDGVVAETILPGYRGKTTQKTIKKAVTALKG